MKKILALYILLALSVPAARCDETHSRYFEQLRQRGLFSLAEAEAISRLSTDELPLATRTGVCIELSRTLAEHAGFAADDQRMELWQRARGAVQDLVDREPANPRINLLNSQIASVFVVEADWLRAEREIRPFDESLQNQAKAACSEAIEQLKSLEEAINEPSRAPSKKRSTTEPMSGHEIRVLQHQIRWQLGQAYRIRAELSLPGSEERTSDLTNAEQALKRLVGVSDEPIQSRARLALVVCLRLKGERDRALEMLTGLEKIDSKPIDAMQDEVIAERVRLMIDLNRPTDAAELLLKTRSQRQRLTGELWFLQVRVLLALREIALGKRQDALADRLGDQIMTTIGRCEDQVGGYWSRRCRQLWENAQTSQKYGAELDSIMQQARTDFTAGRLDVAVQKYAEAERMAAERGQSELAMELGFTRASILLEQKECDTAAKEFFRLASEHPEHPRAAKAHLLGAYCLGRLYDEKRTQARRESYSDALDRHLKDYSRDETVGDATFLRAQFEEQRLQATVALPLYLQIDAEHPRALDAMAGAARCYEAILHRMAERNLPSGVLEREAIERLSKFLSKLGDSVDKWNATHADIALRLAAILLIATGEPSRSPNVGTSLDKTARAMSDTTQSSRCQQAADWLARVASFTQHQKSEATDLDVAKRLIHRTGPLLVVALAGSGKSAEAERNLKLLSSSPADMLTVIDRLSLFAATTRGDQRVRIALLQLQAAERLDPIRDQLTRAECGQLDRCLVKSFVFTNRYPKAVEVAKRLAESSAKEIDVQRDLATLLGEVADRDANLLAKQCWHRVESLTKAGSAEWMKARFGVLEACVRLKQFDEGRKLIQVTKVLYPDLGGDSLKMRFESIEKGLQKASQ